jgi:hypothetical protein
MNNYYECGDCNFL